MTMNWLLFLWILKILYKNGDTSGIDAKNMFINISFASNVIKWISETIKQWYYIQILEILKTMNMFSNVMTAYMILLTILMIVTSVERSFSN